MGKNLRIDEVCESFKETRLVDTPDLRLAEMRSSTSPENIGPLRDRLVEAFDEYDICPCIVPPQACMAIEEALANAFFHGNLELESSLKELDGGTRFSELAKQRSTMLPWKDREVTVTELATPFGLWLTISDEGAGFDVQSVLNLEISPELMLASGRGLVMMKAFSDNLLFNAKGNEVTLVFYSERNRDVKELISERQQSRRVRGTTPHSLI